MAINDLYKIMGVSLITLSLTVFSPAWKSVHAQSTQPTTENPSEAADENLQDAQDSFQRAGQETMQGIEATTEAAKQQAQEAAQNAQQAAQEAEQAAQEAIAMAQERFNWGWLGLLGLLGLFGLKGRNKHRVEIHDRYHQPTTTTTDYR